jgi:hypothetical protein
VKSGSTGCLVFVAFLSANCGCSRYAVDDPDGGGKNDGYSDGRDEDMTECDRVVVLKTGEEGFCNPPGLPCGWVDTGEPCDWNSECPYDYLCYSDRCLRRYVSEASIAEGCVEAWIVLGHGGAAPDRVYSFELRMPAMEQADGSPITQCDDLYMFNKVPCMPLGDECYSYHSSVDVRYDQDGLSAVGASSFALYKLRNSDGTPVGPGWLADGPLRVGWHISWPFSPDDPYWFKSVLKIYLWYLQDGCVTQAFYNTDLPAMGQSLDVEPEITTHCPP